MSVQVVGRASARPFSVIVLVLRTRPRTRSLAVVGQRQLAPEETGERSKPPQLRVCPELMGGEDEDEFEDD